LTARRPLGLTAAVSETKLCPAVSRVS